MLYVDSARAPRPRSQDSIENVEAIIEVTAPTTTAEAVGIAALGAVDADSDSQIESAGSPVANPAPDHSATITSETAVQNNRRPIPAKELARREALWGLFDRVQAAASQQDSSEWNAAWGELWRALEPDLDKFLRIYLDRESVRQDVKSYVAERLVQFLPAVKRQGSLGGWVINIAKHRIIDLTRWSENQRTSLTRDFPERPRDDRAGLPDPYEGPDPAMLVTNHMANAKLTQVLNRALQTVAGRSPQQAAILTQQILYELPLAEIANILGTNEAAVKSAKSRAADAVFRALQADPEARQVLSEYFGSDPFESLRSRPRGQQGKKQTIETALQ